MGVWSSRTFSQATAARDRAYISPHSPGRPHSTRKAKLIRAAHVDDLLILATHERRSRAAKGSSREVRKVTDDGHLKTIQVFDPDRSKPIVLCKLASIL
jgi:hypothetical protein